MTAWEAQVADPRLNQAYNLLLFDQKFHGGSYGPLRAGYTYADYADELAMALDILKVKHAHVVGETCKHLARVLARRRRLIWLNRVKSLDADQASISRLPVQTWSRHSS